MEVHRNPFRICLTIAEARRFGDLNTDLAEVEVVRWRRKVRDAVQEYDAERTQPVKGSSS